MVTKIDDLDRTFGIAWIGTYLGGSDRFTQVGCCCCPPGRIGGTSDEQ
jgi:hypothetical protein